MKADIKKKWVTALCSGKYKKGIGQLKTAEGNFCCLGVLTDLYQKENNSSWGKVTRVEDSVLPKSVMKWAGLDSCDPSIGTGRKLSIINDQTKTGFEGIAKLINKHL